MTELFDLTLSDATKHLPERPHSSTIWRWCRVGLRARNGHRIHLEHQRRGGKLFTSIPSIIRFAQALTEADQDYFRESDPPPGDSSRSTRSRTESERDRSIAEAERILDEAGIGGVS